MKGRLIGLVAILLAASAARADVVVLDDGREIRGKASLEGAKVVIRSEHGETSFPRDSVVKIKSDEDVKREEDAEKKRQEETRQRFGPSEKDIEALLVALSGKAKFELLPAAEQLQWEKDAATAQRLATDAKKIVLTFSVLGELGTGHC
jgi:hypothetical protein